MCLLHTQLLLLPGAESPGPCPHHTGRRAIQLPWASPVPFPEAPSCVSTLPGQVWLSERVLAVHVSEA